MPTVVAPVAIFTGMMYLMYAVSIRDPFHSAGRYRRRAALRRRAR
jgi:hypothetical protein